MNIKSRRKLRITLANPNRYHLMTLSNAIPFNSQLAVGLEIHSKTQGWRMYSLHLFTPQKNVWTDTIKTRKPVPATLTKLSDKKSTTWTRTSVPGTLLMSPRAHMSSKETTSCPRNKGVNTNAAIKVATKHTMTMKLTNTMLKHPLNPMNSKRSMTWSPFSPPSPSAARSASTCWLLGCTPLRFSSCALFFKICNTFPNSSILTAGPSRVLDGGLAFGVGTPVSSFGTSEKASIVEFTCSPPGLSRTCGSTSLQVASSAGPSKVRPFPRVAVVGEEVHREEEEEGVNWWL
mmetsp:Transcript_80792/g.142363  ORF Transcript_80792/g.142363 Transcript_80792/m.142363 type:complete len:290 (+) Transcript_80792:534-1403(+)